LAFGSARWALASPLARAIADYDRDRVRERTVIREREPSERTTVIKKHRGDGVESKTVIHERD